MAYYCVTLFLLTVVEFIKYVLLKPVIVHYHTLTQYVQLILYRLWEAVLCDVVRGVVSDNMYSRNYNPVVKV